MQKIDQINNSSSDEEQQERSQLSKIKISNITYPIIIGLGVVGYLIWKEFDLQAFKHLDFSAMTLFWLFIALLCMVGRDLGYIIRIKLLATGELTWLQAFRIIMLWEFTSAITPSAIGGTSFAIIYVHKEGINLGKSSAIVLLTSFFDELYFVFMFPLMLLIIGKSALFGESSQMGVNFETGIMTIALTGYFLKLIYTLLISYGLFINPYGFKWLLYNVFKLRFLKKWRRKALVVGADIEESSKEIRGKSFIFWIKAIASTFLSWSSRYLVVNAMLLGFFTFSDHFLLFARQLVMWIMMLVMPTPGGSGFSEYLFKEYLGDFIPVAGVAVVMALIWRLITYYPYLIAGAIIFPRWIKSKFPK